MLPQSFIFVYICRKTRKAFEVRLRLFLENLQDFVLFSRGATLNQIGGFSD